MSNCRFRRFIWTHETPFQQYLEYILRTVNCMFTTDKVIRVITPFIPLLHELVRRTNVFESNTTSKYVSFFTKEQLSTLLNKALTIYTCDLDFTPNIR